MRTRLTLGVALSFVYLVAGLVVAGSRPANVSAFTVQNCHDDSSRSRSNTHGSPLNGSFGQVGATPNHSNGYYYLEAQAASGCGVGADGLYHFVGRVTANGTGLLPGCTPSSNWGPPCDPSFRRMSGAAMVNERPAWGFEYKDAASAAIIACTGGDGSGGTNCPGTPNTVANPGDSTVEFRYNGNVSAVRFRIVNQYDDPIWETATLDVVACSGCEPLHAQL